MILVKIPMRSELVIQFAHPAYRMAERFELQKTGIQHFQTWTIEETQDRVTEADVLVISGFWRNELLENAKKLTYIQSIGAGYDQFPLDLLEEQGILLANASGVNADAVSQHAMALVLALIRHLPSGRDNQRQHVWRDMISALNVREDDLCGHTMVIVGLGEIGSRLAKLAKAFGMTVIGVKRDAAHHDGSSDEVYTPSNLSQILGRADFVVLCCPLTSETAKIINANTFSSMKPSCYLINVARGGCVDEPELLAVLLEKRIAGAAIDHFWEEPLPEDSPFWDLDNLMITPHTGGETRKYEDNVVSILIENLEHLWIQDGKLRNHIA